MPCVFKGLFLAVVFTLAGSASPTMLDGATAISTSEKKNSVVKTTGRGVRTAYPDGLVVEAYFRPEGCQEATKSRFGDVLGIHFVGRLSSDHDDLVAAGGADVATEQARSFASSKHPMYRSRPMELVLGQPQLVRCLERGLKGMCIGEKRTITAPGPLGYSAKYTRPAADPTPTGEEIVFDVELVTIGRNIFEAPKELNNLHSSSSRGQEQMERRFFQVVDRDRNGKADRAEFAAYYKRMGIKQTIDDVFVHHRDTNGDDALSWEEYYVQIQDGPHHEL